MRLPILVVFFVYISSTLALSVSLSKPNCPETCGNVTIPYPFGIGLECSANSSFTIICQHSTHPPKPILSSINREVVEIFLEGAIIINLPVSPVNCSDEPTRRTLPISLVGTPFTISAKHNSFANLGCETSAWLLKSRTIVGECTAICDPISTDTSCNGVNCCRATFPGRLKELQYAYRSFHASNGTFCGYVFPVEEKWFEVGYRGHKGHQLNLSTPFDKDFQFAPLVLEWEVFNSWDACPQSSYCNAKGTYSLASTSVCNHDLYPNEYEYGSTNRFCSCPSGFEGNPYLPGGCRDITCSINAARRLGEARICMGGTCTTQNGSFSCISWDDRQLGTIQKIKTSSIIVGSLFGALILVYGVLRSGNAIRKVIRAFKRYRNYKRNGGLLLEQKLASTDSSLEKPKLFSSEELAQATDCYDESCILGRGGQGTVYKGMLTDGKIVAVKKFKKVGARDLDVFINEVVILSQVNHRNVVKLLGCCLENQVPLLVYEFIPKGTLFQHIHEPNEELHLTWEMRVRVAAEVAGALSYLHSAASTPIYHRDIKSTNILLDEKYRAKIADFGTSRSVAIDQTHLTTRVMGTFGYLDPEYFQSSQFTEKSDVYSFGVVMVELLTGEKAVTSIRAESGRNLATHFLYTMDEDNLFDIVDVRVLKEGRWEEILAIAELARRCLHTNGRKRPRMKEVAADLEGIQRGLIEDMLSLQNPDAAIDDPSFELSYQSSRDLSSISGTIHMDTTTAPQKIKMLNVPSRSVAHHLSDFPASSASVHHVANLTAADHMHNNDLNVVIYVDAANKASVGGVLVINGSVALCWEEKLSVYTSVHYSEVYAIFEQ